MRSVPFLPAIEPSEVIWSDEDQEAIGWATKNLDLDQTPVGPRRLRFVLFQYQLGKLILRQHNLVIDQEILTNLATALVDVFLLGSKKRDWGAGSHLFAVLPKLVRTNSVLNKSNVPDSMASDLL